MFVFIIFISMLFLDLSFDLFNCVCILMFQDISAGAGGIHRRPGVGGPVFPGAGEEEEEEEEGEGEGGEEGEVEEEREEREAE